MTFYKLSGGDKFRIEFAAGNDWEKIKCSVSAGHLRAGERITDLRIELPSSKVPHLMRTLLNDWIITEETAMLFEEAGFIGYRLKPVTVVKVGKGSNKDVPALWEFIAMGDGGEVGLKSGIKLRYACAVCGLKRYTDFRQGLFIDEFQWDGSDFFTVWPLPKYIIVTERVKDFIEKHNLSNCRLTPTQELMGRVEDGGLGIA
jgi:hypothetical protein